MTNTKEKAIWKTYPKYPFLQANQFGEIRTIDRIVTCKDGQKRLIKGHTLKQYLDKKGYMYVSFGSNGKHFSIFVHRIVATCFIPNPDNLPEVNHKDNDPTNNAVSNLEWCTRKYNEEYKKKFGTSQAEVSGRQVIAINPETSEVLWFKTQSEASRQLDINVGNISEVANSKRNKASDYWFCYADENAIEKTRNKFGDEIANKAEKLMNEHRN